MSPARLSAVVHRAQPDASVTLRATALAALTTAPVLQAARTALAQGLATAACFAALILLMSPLLTAQTRELTLASLATMGLRRGQAQLLLAAETLPPVVATAMGGVACAWLLAPLVGPSLNLAAFSGTGSAIVVTPAAFPGELTALISAAGSGKSTLVNILAGLDTPTAGTVWVDGHNLGAMTAQQRLAYRRSVAGFIWQQTSRTLLPYMTARQNVLLRAPTERNEQPVNNRR